MGWWKALFNFLGGGVIDTISNDLRRAYQSKLLAETDEAKLEADMTIMQLTLRTQVLLSEQKRWYTAWIRPMLALPVVIFVWKILVWDTVLGWGVTGNPGELVKWIVITVIGAYMLTRPFGRR